jgi:hypothetical protein
VFVLATVGRAPRVSAAEAIVTRARLSGLPVSAALIVPAMLPGFVSAGAAV